ncbi:MAG: hypothetical protein R3C13_07190 [Hyphomonas sp.]|uniref:hypothetical protein n=1 Tax=Hyphomonas sp. TaxID=87 RepID=UPI00352905D5
MTRTPWHLWIVGGVSALWNAFGCFDFTMTATRNEAYLKPYPQEMLDYWLNMPVWVWLIWAVGVFGCLAGSIALLLKRKLAVGFFLASFLAAASSMSMGYFDKNAPRMEGQQYMSFVIIAIALLLVVYARWLSRRDILR